VIVAIGESRVRDSDEIVEELNRLGYRRRLTAGQVSSLMTNKSYRHLFHIDRKTHKVGLSEAGTKRYIQVITGKGVSE
jgi:hypothetical protein